MDTDTIQQDNSVEARVQRGIEWLKSDEARAAFGPIDLGRIDWDRFDITATTECVLGQVIDRAGYFSGYGRVDSWAAENENIDDCTDWMIDHGFYEPDDSSSLAREWRRVLTPAS